MHTNDKPMLHFFLLFPPGRCDLLLSNIEDHQYLIFQYLSLHSPNPNGLQLKILHLIFLYIVFTDGENILYRGFDKIENKDV